MKERAFRFRETYIAMVALSLVAGYTGSELSLKGDRAAVQAKADNKVIKEYGTYDGKDFEKEPEINLDEYTASHQIKYLNVSMPKDEQAYLYALCDAYDIDFGFAMAVIEHESGYTADVISSTGDYGYFQINSCNQTWLSKDLGITDLLDPKQNVRAGMYILRQLFEKYEDAGDVLMAYHFGEGGAKELWNQGIYTSKYSDAILEKGQKYDEELSKWCMRLEQSVSE